MSTNKDQKTWLEGSKAAGNLKTIGAADFVSGGMLQSLPGAEALEALEKMSYEELAVSLSGEWGVEGAGKEAEAQGDGDPGVDPTSPSPASSDSSPSPSDPPSDELPTKAPSTSSEEGPSESSSAIGGEAAEPEKN